MLPWKCLDKQHSHHSTHSIPGFQANSLTQIRKVGGGHKTASPAKLLTPSSAKKLRFCPNSTGKRSSNWDARQRKSHSAPTQSLISNLVTVNRTKGTNLWYLENIILEDTLKGSFEKSLRNILGLIRGPMAKDSCQCY